MSARELTDAQLSAALNYPARVCTEFGIAFAILFGRNPRGSGNAWWLRCAIEYDVLMSVLTDGALGITVSCRVGLLRRAYREHQTRNPTGCWICWFLGWAVQRDHCDLVLENDAPPTPVFDIVRAGIAFGVASLVAAVTGLGLVYVAVWAAAQI